MTAADLSRDVVYVGTSWKMTKTLEQTREFFDAMREWDGDGRVQAFVLPPLTALAEAVAMVADGTDAWVGAQNGHFAAGGAFTGEVSMAQIADAGATVVEVGHAERRSGFGESDESVALKVRAAVNEGLTPVLCVGETALVRDQGGHIDFVLGQIMQAMSGLRATDHSKVMVAYEPVWAIGAGGKEATPADVAEVMAAIAAAWPETSVIYGGSVDPGNAQSYLDIPSCGGIFVGRAAWQPQGFLELLRIAQRTARSRRESNVTA